MISKILVIADPSKEGLELVLDALQTVRKHHPSIEVIFVSSLSEISLKNLGSNILNLLFKEQKQAIERAEEYFTRMDIPHQFTVIASPHWDRIFDEMRKGNQDLIIFQGEFLRVLREDDLNQELYSQINFKPKCPILVINEPETVASCGSFYSESSGNQGSNIVEDN